MSKFLPAQRSAALLGSVSFFAMFSAAWAQEEQATQEPIEVQEDADRDVIIVGAERRRGTTLSTVEPELVLSESDIEAYGVSSLAELLAELAPETSSGRSRRGGGGGPVVLLNGRRISGFREIGRYPPEALARVEVLPEEAALAYGFNADQRVINFILKPNIIVRAAEAEVEAPEQGGTATTEWSFQRLSVDGSRRFSVDLRFEDQSELLERERDFVSQQPAQPFASPGNLGANNFGDPIGALLGADPSFTVAALQDGSFDLPIVGGQNPQAEQEFRTLRPETSDWSIGFSRSDDFLWESVLTFTGEFQASERTSLLGLGNVALDLPGSNPFVPFGDGLTLYTQVPSDGALVQENETDVYSGGFSVISKPGRTNWTLTGSYEVSQSDTLTQTGIVTDPLQQAVDLGADPFAVLAGDLERSEISASSETRTTSAELVVNSKTVELPGGDVQVSAQAGYTNRELDTENIGQSGLTESSLSRETFRSQINVDVPIFDSLDYGRLSLNGNVNWRDLSDFGSLTTWGGGFNYRPSEKLRLLASYTREEGAPGISQIGNPSITTPNVRVFDFTTGETVLVDVTSGGNPDLIADTREITKVGLQLKPWDERELTLNIDYTQSLLEDEARDFPALTAEVEAAFPDRFTRDTDGTLIALDNRAVNFEEGTQRQIRTGLNWSKRLGGRGGRPTGGRPGGGRPPGVSGGPSTGRPNTAGGPPQGRPATAGAPPAGQPSREAPQSDARAQNAPSGRPQQGGRPSGRPQASGQGGGQRPSGPRRSGRPGRMSVSLTHVWVLEDTLTIRDGLPELDLLNGSAIGANGGTPEHEVNLTLRRYNKGLGIFGRVSWTSGTDVNGDLSGGSDLAFSDLLTANIRMSYDLTFSDTLMEKARWLEDTRVSFGVDNIFNQRVEVRDASGIVPIQYQPDLIDPLGRVFEFEIRKRF